MQLLYERLVDNVRDDGSQRCNGCAVPPSNDNTRHVAASIQPQSAGREVDYLLGEFSGLDPVVVQTVYENASGNAAAAYSILKEIAGGDDTDAAQQVRLDFPFAKVPQRSSY